MVNLWLPESKGRTNCAITVNNLSILTLLQLHHPADVKTETASMTTQSWREANTVTVCAGTAMRIATTTTTRALATLQEMPGRVEVSMETLHILRVHRTPDPRQVNMPPRLRHSTALAAGQGVRLTKRSKSMMMKRTENMKKKGNTGLPRVTNMSIPFRNSNMEYNGQPRLPPSFNPKPTK